MNNFNVVWIMIDSVRRYHTKGDDRSRLEYMDQFAKQGVEFLNCVTSAPSTLMSLSATLTSLPSYHIGRNYADFQFDRDYFKSLTSILKENNYRTNRAFVMHPLVRERLKQFDLVPKRLWPRGLSHKDWFCNDEINAMVHSVLNEELKVKSEKPSFWFIDYNCRNDENISNIVKNTAESLDKAGFTKDNTILMISSDHGYPDPRRGITPETLKQKKLSHDVFMTDDNIMIPLTIRYPGCIPGKKINHTVSTLDILPTLLDLLEITVPSELRNNFHGVSLVPLIDGSQDKKYEDRKIRTDARLIDQPGRLTAIRGDRYKYIYDHDKKREEFVFIGDNENALVEKSVYKTKDNMIQQQLGVFREEFQKSEASAVHAQHKYFSYKLNNLLRREIKNRSKPKILLAGFLETELLEVVSRNLEKEFYDSLIDAVLINSSRAKRKISHINEIFYVDYRDKEIFDAKQKLYKMPQYDYLINISDIPTHVEKNAFYKLNSKLNYRLKIKTSARKSTPDYSSTIVRKVVNLKDHLLVAWKNRNWYLEEPSMIFKEPITILRLIFKKEVQINGGWRPYKYFPRKLKRSQR